MAARSPDFIRLLPSSAEILQLPTKCALSLALSLKLSFVAPLSALIALRDPSSSEKAGEKQPS